MVAKLWYVEIEGIAVGGYFETRAAAQRFASMTQGGEVVEREDFSAPPIEDPSAPEPQEMDPTRMLREDR